MGLPPLPPHGHPLAGHPGVNGAPHLAGPHHVLTSSASGVIGRPTSTPSTGTNAFNGKLYFLLLSKFEAITHARGQKVYFPSIIGGLLDLLLLSMSTCRIFTIQKFVCFSINSNHYSAVEFFWLQNLGCVVYLNLLSSITNQLFLHLLYVFSPFFVVWDFTNFYYYSWRFLDFEKAPTVVHIIICQLRPPEGASSV